MDRIDQLWQRIEAGWANEANAPILPAGASENAIAAVEQVLEVALPDDVRASYLRHDGGYSVKLVSEMEALPLAGIIEWWKTLEELRQDEDWARQIPYHFRAREPQNDPQHAPFQPIWWHRRWIPIAVDVAGNVACIDLAPAAGGISGQLIDWDHEVGPSRVLFPSFERMLAALAEQVDSGH